MKIAIYSPYLDTCGGGERYILTIAEYLSGKHQVDLLFDKHLWSLGPKLLLSNLSRILNLKLDKVEPVLAPIGLGSNFLMRLSFLKKYDYFFYITDGSIFFSTAKNSILHFQVPFENIAARGPWGNIKLKTFKMAILNSAFTKDIVQKTWPINGKVVYPPVDINSFKLLKKKNNILSVGRFFNFLHSKKQEILVDVFKKMVQGGLKEWKLQLAGGTNEAGQQYLQNLKKRAEGFPIEFYPDVPFEDLKNLYGEASIYWHAAGFGETDPKKMEHFGITTVEAMAAGVVPVVIDSGGQKEIVNHGQNGFLWSSEEDLIKFTQDLIGKKSILEVLSKNAIERSRSFDKEKFCKQIDEIISGKVI